MNGRRRWRRCRWLTRRTPKWSLYVIKLTPFVSSFNSDVAPAVQQRSVRQLELSSKRSDCIHNHQIQPSYTFLAFSLNPLWINEWMRSIWSTALKWPEEVERCCSSTFWEESKIYCYCLFNHSNAMPLESSKIDKWTKHLFLFFFGQNRIPSSLFGHCLVLS